MNRIDLQSLQAMRDCDYDDTVWEQTKDKIDRAITKMYDDLDNEVLRLLLEGTSLEDIAYVEPRLPIDYDLYTTKVTDFLRRL